MHDGPSDAEVALAAAAAGVAVVRAAYGGSLTRQVKTGLDFTTDVDLAAERAILQVITAARPNDGTVGEETGTRGGSGSRRWLVDPLCGTLNYAARTPLVAVNVALVDDSTTLACVSADPIAVELFWGDGEQAWVRRDGSDHLIHPSATSGLVDVNCDDPPDEDYLGPQFLGDRDFRAAFSPRVLSTTLAVAWVAAGRRTAYVSDGLFADNVHFAAGIGLCRSAGCMVTALDGGPLNQSRGLIAAADPETHQRLVRLVRPYLDAGGGSASSLRS